LEQDCASIISRFHKIYRDFGRVRGFHGIRPNNSKAAGGSFGNVPFGARPQNHYGYLNWKRALQRHRLVGNAVFEAVDDIDKSGKF
jgi:hypothetical protein